MEHTDYDLKINNWREKHWEEGNIVKISGYLYSNRPGFDATLYHLLTILLG